MTRVLHLLDSEADFQTRYCADMLSARLGEPFRFSRVTIGRGGNLPQRLSAIRFLRKQESQFDILHAWASQAATIADLGWSKQILHTPEPESNGSVLQGPNIRIANIAPGAEL